MAKPENYNGKILSDNRKARFNYEIIESLECGIELHGTEVKSLRDGLVNFVDGYCEIKNGELFLSKVHVSPYNFGNIHNHAAERSRKLLAHKREIYKWERAVREKGMTLIPLRLYLKGKRVKVLVGLCRGKKLYDKRESLKVKDLKREAARDGARAL